MPSLLRRQVWTTNAVVILVLLLGLGIALAACGSDERPNAASTQIGAAVLAQGESLYAENCASCHGFESGGDIRDIPPPHNSNGHTWHHPDQQLEEIVIDGLDFAVPGQPTMPAFGDTLTRDQVRAILAYIKTWWTDEQRSFQATVTAGAAR